MNTPKRIESRWARELRLELEAIGEARGLAMGKVEGKAEGEAKGKREALLTITEVRGLRLSRADRTTILSCSDLATLEGWIARAATASTLDEVLVPANALRKKGSPGRALLTKGVGKERLAKLS